MIASVVLDIKNNQLNQSYDYIIPVQYESVAKIGSRVFAPFGSRNLMGFIVDINDDTKSDYNLKSIISVLDLEPVINLELIKLGSLLASEYFSFLIENYLMMIPKALKANYVKLVDFKNYDNSLNSVNLIKGPRAIAPLDDFKECLGLIKNLKQKGLIDIHTDFKEKNQKKYEKLVRLVDSSKSSSKKQEEIVKYLLEANCDTSYSMLVNDMGYSKSALSTLEANGAIEIVKRELYRSASFSSVADKQIVLNDEQAKAYEIIKESSGFNEFLLKGVCGSGKTEVYLNLIEDTIKAGKQAIMLVPEISLTPQMASRFKARFNDLVAIIHSQMSDGERYDEWRRIKDGKAKIVVGARSALFVPMSSIGLIIMDEEQSESYIQDNNPRYDSHFVAQKRAEYHQCPLIYGSATPSIKTNYFALNGKIKLLTLNKRANNKPLPISFIVDMRQELMSGNRSVLSRSLKENLIETLKRKEQAVLLINRRGYSTFVMCRSCGEEIKCPHCDVSMTYHKNQERLVCHYCGYKALVPTRCPKCGSPYIKYVGDGTQKLEEELNKTLPEARVIRMDSDTTSKKNSHDEIITKFSNHEADILLGTQVVAKGLDFPLVSLVGIVNADLGLKMPFYDAYEKTYDLLEQASGRAGRKGTDGKVIIQTYNPDNIVIKAAQAHNYDLFYEEELKLRRISQTPPFKNLIEIIVSSPDQQEAYKEIHNLRNLIFSQTKAIVLGPVSHYIFKIKDRYQYELTIKLSDEDMSILSLINQRFQKNKKAYISIKRM